MKRIKSIPKILKIISVDGYKVSCLFSNGETRIIDFKKFFTRKKLHKSHPARKLLKSKEAFNKIEIIGNTIGWKNVGLKLKNIKDETVFYSYDIDPIVLFEFSSPDPDRGLKVGELIRNERQKAGLTQEQLARKSGTSRDYISKLENEKSDIELLTLKKIIEAGLDRELKIQIK